MGTRYDGMDSHKRWSALVPNDTPGYNASCGCGMPGMNTLLLSTDSDATSFMPKQKHDLDKNETLCLLSQHSLCLMHRCSPGVHCRGVNGSLQRGWWAGSSHCNNQWHTVTADVRGCVTVRQWVNQRHTHEMMTVPRWCPHTSSYHSLHTLFTMRPHTTSDLLKGSIAVSHADSATFVKAADVTHMTRHPYSLLTKHWHDDRITQRL